MKIIYKKTMYDLVIEAISEAKIADREIEHIELSDREFDKLRASLPLHRGPKRRYDSVTLDGVAVIKQDF